MTANEMLSGLVKEIEPLLLEKGYTRRALKIALSVKIKKTTRLPIIVILNQE